jgi:hypothetical protein
VIYISYRPGPPLNEFVEYFWLIEGGQAQRLEKILPSGTIELVINLKQDEIHHRSAFGSWKLSYKLVFTISRGLNFKQRLRSR